MQDDPLIGTSLGAYLIQSRLGEGGMARVYKAYHARLRRDVAIKVILSRIADRPDFQARFEREAQLIASLEHPNIVAVYDFGEVENLTYLVMQYVGGGTLRDLLRKESVLDPRRAAQFAQQMARALHHAHLRGIVHRDVKPQNMLVSANDPSQLLLSDFGIAKLFDTGQEVTLLPSGTLTHSDPSLTYANQIVGTAEYMSPEQAQGKPVDARSDVYSLGVVLYQMLTGQVPFSSTTLQGLLFQHVYTVPRPVREVNPYAPEILAQITSKAMAKAPEDRFQSAEAMAQALEAAMSQAMNRFSAPPTGNYVTSEDDYRTLPSSSRMAGAPLSYYGPQSHSVADTGPQGQHSAYGTAGTTPNTGLPKTHPNGSRLAAPPLAHPKSRIRVSYIGAAVLILLSIALVVARQHPFSLPGSSSPSTTSSAQSFTEDFHNNDRNWTVGNIGHLTASVASLKYTLAIDNADSTYFPNPSAVGTLPNNFTLSAQMMQTQGGTNVFYGLAFHLTQNGSNVSCYTFVVNGSGDYEVLKYDPASQNGYSRLWQGQSAAIKTGLHQVNTLQAVVQGSNFSFMINNQPVQVQLSSADTAAYTGGRLALLVAGPNTTFEVTSMKLAIS